MSEERDEPRIAVHPGIVADAARQLIDADNTTDALMRKVAVLRIQLDRANAELDKLAAGEASDGYHTHNELYEYRLLYNAALFTAWHEIRLAASSWEQFFGCSSIFTVPRVCKSWNHSDGLPALGSPNWFIVVAELPTGQISNHYHKKHWNLFQIPAVPIPPKYDGHTPAEAAQRLRDYLSGPGTPPPNAVSTPEESAPVSETPKACGRMVHWWEGEYEGACELPDGHDGDHWDGTSWFDDDNECTDYLHGDD